MQIEIQGGVRRVGIDLGGAADLCPALARIVDRVEAICVSYLRVVSLGCRLANELVDATDDHSNRAVVAE